MRHFNLIVISILTVISLNAKAATPAQCYLYFTELVRSSNFPFAEWEVKPKNVNLIIDEDNSNIIRAKLFIDTEGTGTIGWVEFSKTSNNLYNITSDPDFPIKLKFNTEYLKSQESCLNGHIIYQVDSSGRLYLMEKIADDFTKTNVFIVNGDYVEILDIKDGYSFIRYKTKKGDFITGWVKSNALRKIDFISSW